MREASAWMPLYVGDYLADTMHLSTVEHGAYLLLIMAYWKRGSALPDDDRALASITRLPLKRWISARSTLVDMFQNGEGCWRHQRIEIELERSRSFMAKQLENGKKGGRPAKPKANPDETHGIGLANPGLNPNVTPSQSQSPKKEPVAEATDADASIAVSLSDQQLVWGWGLIWLSSSTGKPDRSLRSLIGRWCKAYTPTNVLIALRAAEAQSPPIVDPVSWIVAALETRSLMNGKANEADTQRSAERIARVVARLQQRAGHDLDGVPSGNGLALLPPVSSK